MDEFKTGSSYFFGDMEGYIRKGEDKIVLVDEPHGFVNVRQTDEPSGTVFEWRRMKADEFVEVALKTRFPESAGKFLCRDFAEEIGFKTKHLKKLSPLFDGLEGKYGYLKTIYGFIISNGSWELTDEQLKEAYESYKKARDDYGDMEERE